VATATVTAGAEHLPDLTDGAEGEKSAGMVGAAPLVFGSKGAAEQTRFWKRPCSSAGPFPSDTQRVCRGKQFELRFADLQLDLKSAACVSRKRKGKARCKAGLLSL